MGRVRRAYLHRAGAARDRAARSRAELDWKLPLEGRQYWRSSVAELLPDPLSPLFATLALPLWNEALQAMAESTRMRLLIDSDVELVTIHDYAYYSFALTAWQTLRLVAASPVRIPRMIRTLRSAESGWANEARPRYAKEAGDWTGRDLAATPALELLAGGAGDRRSGGRLLCEHPACAGGRERERSHLHERVQPPHQARLRPAGADLPAGFR